MLIDDFAQYISSISPLVNLKPYTIVNIQNVADYVMMQNDNEYFDKEEFKQTFPPWNQCILMFKLPPYSFSKEHGMLPSPTPLPDFVCVCHTKDNYFTVEYYSKVDGQFVYFGGSIHHYDDNKCLLQDVDQNGKYRTKTVVMEDDPRHHQYSAVIASVLSPVVLFAFQFCHCKNVSKKENHYQLNFIKQRQRRNKFPIMKFYTLEIDPRTRSKSSSTHDSTHHNSLHICRGHFKNYTKDAPLFGRYTGTVWCPMHTKGSSINGEVIKGYDIKT